jgi:hypothetical protein
VLSITLPWFFVPGYLFFTDSVWGPTISTDWHSASYLVNICVLILSKVIPVDVLEKLFISGVFAVLLWGGKRFVEESVRLFGIASNYWLVFTVSLFAVFNPFVYDRVLYGQLGVAISLGFLFLFIAELSAYFREQRMVNAIRVGIFSGLSILFASQYVFFDVLLGLVFVCNAILQKNIQWKKILLQLGMAIVIALAINANWFIANANPQSQLNGFISQGISTQDLTAFETAGTTNLQVVTNVLMMSGFWGKDQYRYLDLTKVGYNWGRSFFILLPIIFIGVSVALRRKETRILSIFLFLAFCIATILAIGIRLPFCRGITEFLFAHLPFYKGLREPQKWVSILVTIYFMYLAIGSAWILRLKIISRNAFICGCVLVGVIIMQAPFLLFGLYGQVSPTPYPQDWYQANQLIIQTNEHNASHTACQGNTLFLPWHLYMSFSWIGNIVATPAQNFFTCPILSSQAMEWGGIYDNSTSPTDAVVEAWLQGKGDTDLLTQQTIPVQYIILAKEVDWQKYVWIENLSGVHMVQNSPTLMVFSVTHEKN